MYTDYNYRYIVTPTKVIALSTYAGKTVRGVAKCHPTDEFNEEYGKKLAAARCNQKIAAKRYERAFRKYRFMCEAMNEVEREFSKSAAYLRDAAAAEKEAILSVMEIRKESIHDN